MKRFRRGSGSIFKNGDVVLKPFMEISDPFEALVAFAMTKYRSEFDAVRDQCPYNTDLGTDLLVLKQQLTWFVLDRINPATRTTIAEEFIKMPDVPSEMVKFFMQAIKLFYDEFKVIKYEGKDLLVHGKNTRKKYRVMTVNRYFYPIGGVFEGRIHPYDNKYKICGIAVRRLST